MFAYRLLAQVSLWLTLLTGAVGVVSVWEAPAVIALDIFLPPHPGAKAWWLSIILAGYTWYRFDREKYWYKVPARDQATVVIEEYLSEDIWRVLEQAYHYAERVAHTEVSPTHLMAAALKNRTVVGVLVRLGVDISRLIRLLQQSLANEEQGWHAKLSGDSIKVFQRAAELAWQRQTKHLELTELIVALSASDSRLKDIMEELDINSGAVANVTAWLTWRRKIISQRHHWLRRAQYRPRHALDRAYVAVETPFLSKVARDLTADAARGYLGPCLARESELEQIYDIIQGGQGGVVLVGESGVGKNKILEGLAQAMAADEVPKIIKDKRLYALSLPRLLSGATPAEASGRWWRALTEAIRAGNIVLAIDGIEKLSGDASGANELSLRDILANTISEYHLIVLATATPSAWRNLQETSPLGQALQAVEIKELDTDGAIQVLESYIPRLEYKHRVFFSYAALEKTVVLSRRYMPDRYLPAKAIDLLDELAVYVREHKGKNALVTAEDVAQLVAGKVHVPLTQVTEAESEKLLNLEQVLHRRIIGQDEAVKLVAEALRRARVNLRDQKRPVASFLFLGPTGVGKTELAKVVASEYFGGEDKMIRLDMSEYQTDDSVYRLLGAPASSHEHGLLTESVRRSPYSLILLDEIEKAHPDILNVFLQILDDGRATDASGRTVDFTNTIIIATSNAGTQFIQESLRNQVPIEYIRRTLIESGLKQYFHPEFLNRFDGIVVFKPLLLNEIEQVAGLLVGKLAQELEARGIHLQASLAAVKELAARGFDPLYGARPLKRAIQDNVDSALAKYLLTGKLSRRDVVVLEPGGAIRVEKARKL